MSADNVLVRETRPVDNPAASAGPKSAGDRITDRIDGVRGFSASTPRALLLLIAGDVLLLQLAVAFATFARWMMSSLFPIEVGPATFVGVHAAVLLLPVGFAMAGLYPGYGCTGVERLRVRTIVTSLCLGGMILFDYLAQNGQWSRGILIVATLLALLVLPVWDAVARRWLHHLGWWGMPAVILGPVDRRRLVVQALHDHALLGWVPVAEGEWPEEGDVAVLGVDLAILVPPGPQAGALPIIADELPYRRVVLVPNVVACQSLWVSVRDIGTHLGLEMQRNLLVPGNRFIKRMLDLALTALAVPVALPVIALFAVLVKIVSPGPAFYRQVREGLDGRTFCMWKLRTMAPDAEQRLSELIATSPEVRAEWESHMKLRHDPRIVPGIGAFMRRFSIDELPQLWNVIRGDMSLVGPRPLPHYHLAALSASTYRLRQRVRPGVTGLWQVSGRSAAGLDGQEHLDVYYVRNWSLWLDVHILARTVLAVLGGKGAW